MPLGIDLGSIFPPSLITSRINLQTMPEMPSHLDSIFGRVHGPLPPTSIPCALNINVSPYESKAFFQRIVFRRCHRVLTGVCARMPPVFLPASLKILPHIDPKMHHLSD